jgi:hypothetical protein
VKSKWFVAMTILGPVFAIRDRDPALIASKAVVGKVGIGSVGTSARLRRRAA